MLSLSGQGQLNCTVDLLHPRKGQRPNRFRFCHVTSALISAARGEEYGAVNLDNPTPQPSRQIRVL